jgi:phosphoesterase RecJ-like protein
LGSYNTPVKESKAFRIIIDHHPVQQEWCDLALIDEQRIATAELVYDLFKEAHWPITLPMAEALYAGILSDSGSFRFFKTDARTFRMASELVEIGVEPSLMFSRIFEVARLGQLRAWGELLAGLNQQGVCTWMAISKSFMQEHKLELHEIDGLIDIMRRETTSQVFVVFVEKEADEILVGLRSKGDFNVGVIARSFGGGGHFHASGFTSKNNLQKTIGETMNAVLHLNTKETQ